MLFHRRVPRAGTFLSRLKLGIAAIASLAVGTTFVAVEPTFAIPAPGAVRYAAVGPEAQLAQVFEHIEQNQLDIALQQVEVLTHTYPNFRLAQLVKGDLLLARGRMLHGFGNAPNAASEQIADLRDEARARLLALRNKPPQDQLPRYLLQLQETQKYAIVVDAAKSRLYLYQNDQGTPRLIDDYYVTQGKLGAEKLREGDKKTPLGVYHVTASLSPQRLGDFYGSGAYPINYPNEWDKRNGRNGHGIWLHGTPSNTYARPPKASDGCVVLANEDLDALAKHLQIGLTPVIIANGIEWVSPGTWQQERDGLLTQIETWRNDWESMDVNRYLRHYSRDFNAGRQDIEAWSEHKRRVADNKQWIKVELDKLSVLRNPGQKELVVVTFEQNYRSDNLNNVMKKRQYWQKEGQQWKIIYEGAA